MFNLLVSGASTTWEVAQPWSMEASRFKEHSGNEGSQISAKDPKSLQALEAVPALLMYEWGHNEVHSDIVRFGYLANIIPGKGLLQFNFNAEMHCDRELIEEFATDLGFVNWERGRTHWAIKDGDIPREMIEQMVRGPYQAYRYEIVLSYAGEEHAYVEQVAAYLRDRGVKIFFAPFREADLWGKDMTEELDIIYRMEGRFCVMFLSENYAKKAWPTHERRSAMARAVEQPGRYILPCRFDNTEMPGLRSSVHYVDLNTKLPEELGELIVEVLRRKRK